MRLENWAGAGSCKLGRSREGCVCLSEGFRPRKEAHVCLKSQP